jgi:hypothetical protein
LAYHLRHPNLPSTWSGISAAGNCWHRAKPWWGKGW